jgi:hypothetical protein
MHHRFSRTAFAFVFLLSIFGIVRPVALAQDGVPNIVGNYTTAGTLSYVDCDVNTIPEQTFPLIAPLAITDQTGSAFHGTLFTDEQGHAYVTFTGTVDAAGMLSGTWDFADIPDDHLINLTFTGAVENGNLTIDFIADYAFDGDIFCSVKISLSSGAIYLSWTAPEAPTGETLPPPRDLVVIPLDIPGHDGATAAKSEAAAPTAVTGYKIYRSTQPNVQPSPNNIFATLPPNQTSIPAAAGLRGSYFVVTACYATGESAPSNEVSASATPGPTITSLKPAKKKLTAVGTGFVAGTRVEINGVGFTAAPKLKKNSTKFIQKGTLVNGQTIVQALAQSGPIQITFRNPDGGITNLVLQ